MFCRASAIDSRAADEKMNQFIDSKMTRPILEAVQGLVPVAEAAGLSMAQLSLAWVLRQPNVASAIIGATRPEQVRDNAAAAGRSLDEGTLAAIDELIGPVVPG